METKPHWQRSPDNDIDNIKSGGAFTGIVIGWMIALTFGFGFLMEFRPTISDTQIKKAVKDEIMTEYLDNTLGPLKAQDEQAKKEAELLKKSAELQAQWNSLHGIVTPTPTPSPTPITSPTAILGPVSKRFETSSTHGSETSTPPQPKEP